MNGHCIIGSLFWANNGYWTLKFGKQSSPGWYYQAIKGTTILIQIQTCMPSNQSKCTNYDKKKNSPDVGHLHSIKTCFNSQSTAINVSKYTHSSTRMHMHTNRLTKTNTQLGQGQRFSTMQMSVFHDISTMQILILCADLEKDVEMKPINAPIRSVLLLYVRVLKTNFINTTNFWILSGSCFIFQLFVHQQRQCFPSPGYHR